MSELSNLYSAIVKEYGEKGVNVNLNNSNVLTITFINSSLNDKGEPERQQRAKQTADFVVKHYASIAKINEIWVGFIKQKTQFILLTYTEGLGYFGFNNKAGDLVAENRSLDTYPKVVYSVTTKQTDISVTRLQLEGDLNNGVAVVPHFSVPGDATGLRRSPVAPKFVGLDFASFGAKPRFDGDTKLSLIADDKVVFEMTDRFSNSRLPNGYSEFLMAQIPYPSFLKFAKAEELTISLSDKTYHLTNEQRTGLREMTRYVKE